jgi:hypothetical protein
MSHCASIAARVADASLEDALTMGRRNLATRTYCIASGGKVVGIPARKLTEEKRTGSCEG